jgi:hypothetical protein
MAFSEEMARIENSITSYAGRLLGSDRSRFNFAAREHAPSLLPIIRRMKIERAIARRDMVSNPESDNEPQGIHGRQQQSR